MPIPSPPPRPITTIARQGSSARTSGIIEACHARIAFVASVELPSDPDAGSLNSSNPTTFS